MCHKGPRIRGPRSSSTTFVLDLRRDSSGSHILANRKSAGASADKVGEIRYKRGVFNAALTAGAIRSSCDKAVGGEDVRRDIARARSNVVIFPSRLRNGATGKALISVACYTAAWSPFVIDAFASASPRKMARYRSSP